MASLFAFLFLLSILALLLSLAKPSLFYRFFVLSRGKYALLFGGIAFACMFMSAMFAPPTNPLQNIKGDVKSAEATRAPSISSLHNTELTITLAPTHTPTPSPMPTATQSPTIIPTKYPSYTLTPTTIPITSIQWAPIPTSTPTPIPAQSSQSNQQFAPAGATAICVDGTYSYSQHRSGTCSHHGGVTQWL